MGVPAIEVSAIPMAKSLPNVLDLPFVSRFVKMAIAAGVSEVVAPKSMTLNVQELLSAAAIGGLKLSFQPDYFQRN
jgi:Ca2+-dependent lipid-binding protein